MVNSIAGLYMLKAGPVKRSEFGTPAEELLGRSFLLPHVEHWIFITFGRSILTYEAT